jgi:probable HAF family extracellular repeat protein
MARPGVGPFFPNTQETLMKRIGHGKRNIGRGAIAAAVSALCVTPSLATGDDGGQRQKLVKHHHYQLIDIGTFGGPASYINNQISLGAPNQINSRGAAVGAAATSIPAPPNSNDPICQGQDGIVPFVFHAFKWQDGAVTDLGTLPGDDNCSVATSINANGEIAGYGENGLVDPLTGIREDRALVWENGEMIDLGTFGGNESVLGNINNRGQVAGSATNTIPDPFSIYYLLMGLTTGTQTRAFLWQNGQKQDLGTLGGPDAAAFFVNERGQVSGISYTNSTPNPTTGLPTQDPFLWDKGRMIDIGTLGGTYGIGGYLNNRGDVAGYSNLAGDQTSHPFIWRGGILSDLSTSTIGGSPITVNQLNDNGDLVGAAAFPDEPYQAYLWRKGVATELGHLEGDCDSEAVALNSRSQVVGYSVACDFSSQRSFLWENGSMVDLNTLIPPDSGLKLVEALAINDRGEIAGGGHPPGCQHDASCGHAYVLIPCDEGHPGIGGCDYSMVEVPQNAVMPAPPRAPATRPSRGFVTGGPLSGFGAGRGTWMR